MYDPEVFETLRDYGAGLAVAAMALVYSVFLLATMAAFSGADMVSNIMRIGLTAAIGCIYVMSFMFGTSSAPKRTRLLAVITIMIGVPALDAVCCFSAIGDITLAIVFLSFALPTSYTFFVFMWLRFWPPPNDGYDSDDDSGLPTPPDGGGRLWQVERISLKFHESLSWFFLNLSCLLVIFPLNIIKLP